MSLNTHIDNNKVVIEISGKFDFSLNNEFRDAYKNNGDRNNSTFIVDLKSTEYMDSSGLGMILLLKEFCGHDKSRIVIQSPNSTIRRVLDISNFSNLVTIQ